MAKSQRSKREKRLRAIRRELAEPFYDKKDAVKLAVQEEALAAQKLPVRQIPKSDSAFSMDIVPPVPVITTSAMDVEMDGDDDDKNGGLLKPSGGVGKKTNKKKRRRKAKQRRKGKGKLRRRHV